MKQNFYRFGVYGIRGLNGLSGSNVVDERFVADFPLVGSNEKATTEFCNVFSRNKICDKTWLHEGKPVPEDFLGVKPLDGVIGKDAVVAKPHASHCSDPLCPLCCYNWAKKTAKRCMMRFEVFDSVFAGLFELRHVVVSVPEYDYFMDFDYLRKQATVFAEAVGVVGGCLIYHPKRDKDGKWYYSPHFHILGYVPNGFVDGKAVAVIQKLTGYVLKNLEERISVLGTLLYQLSHAGVVGRSKSVCWFGELVFNKGNHEDLGELLRANIFNEKMNNKGCLCPVCGNKMVHGCRTAKSPYFDYELFEDRFILDNVSNWVVVPDVKRGVGYGYEDDG